MKTNTILLIVATLVVAGGAYWYFFTGSSDQLPLTVSTTTNRAQIQFQQLASQLSPITFNTGIFNDQRFMALVDLTTSIAPETVGRLDPFSPVAGVSGGASSVKGATGSSSVITR